MSRSRSAACTLHCLLYVSIDQLNKTDVPLIPYLLGIHCLVSLSDGLAGYAFPFYNAFAVQQPPAGSTEPVQCRQARASRGPLLPPHHKSVRPTFRRCPRRVSDARLRRRVSHFPPLATRSLLPSRKPHSYHASSLALFKELQNADYVLTTRGTAP